MDASVPSNTGSLFTEGLVTLMTPAQKELWLHNAYFKAAATQFAHFVRMALVGLEAEAERVQADIDKRVEEFKNLPDLPLPECTCGKHGGPGEHHGPHCPMKVWR